MDRWREPTTVGSYLDAKEAERAADHLRAEGFEDIEVVHPSDAVWLVRLPLADAHTAIDVLLRDEKHAVERL